MTRDVYKIAEDGTQSFECSFVNDFDARYNMISLLMGFYGRGIGMMIPRERKKFESMVVETESNVFFEHNKDVYIMRK